MTVLTMTTAVLLAYAGLFALVFVAAIVFVPSGYLQSTLRHPVDPGDYARITWLATFVGALGSTLEDEETVRDAVYGYRQGRRQAEDADDSEEGSAK